MCIEEQLNGLVPYSTNRCFDPIEYHFGIGLFAFASRKLLMLLKVPWSALLDWIQTRFSSCVMQPIKKLMKIIKFKLQTISVL